MNSESISTVKLLSIVIIVAVVAAVLAAVLQVLIVGKSNAALTGGAVGAITSGIAISLRKKKSGSA
jgi:flagellar basal body-associated protein FliL